MAQFSKGKSIAQKQQERVNRLRANGRHDLVKPNEAYRTAHSRPDDAYREHKGNKGPNGKAWKGAKGKQKRQCFPK